MSRAVLPPNDDDVAGMGEAEVLAGLGVVHGVIEEGRRAMVRRMALLNRGRALVPPVRQAVLAAAAGMTPIAVTQALRKDQARTVARKAAGRTRTR